jgi:hypothetical protein
MAWREQVHHSRDSDTVSSMRVDFRSRSQRRTSAKVSAPSAGFGHTFGYAGGKLKSVSLRLNVKPSPLAATPASTTSSILDFAAGEISYDTCFGKDDMLPESEEKPESTSVGIKSAPKKAPNLNSVRQHSSE